MAPNTCPQCRSEVVDVTRHNGLVFLHCRRCGYDDALHEVVPGQRTSQREKGRYSPYKAGGKGRVRQ